jgi:hypothetical protein
MAKAAFHRRDVIKEVRQQEGFGQKILCPEFSQYPVVFFRHRSGHDEDRGKATTLISSQVLQYGKIIGLRQRGIKKKEVHLFLRENREGSGNVISSVDLIPQTYEILRDHVAEKFACV